MKLQKLGLAHALSSKVNYEVKNTSYHGNLSHVIIKFIGKCEEKLKEKHINRALGVTNHGLRLNILIFIFDRFVVQVD